MTDLRPSLDPAFTIFGVDVTLPLAPDAGVTVTVRAIPLPYRAELVALGTDVREAGRRILYAFRRADVPSLPRGTLLEGPEIQGGETVTWKVELLEFLGPDECRAVCVRV